MDKEDQFYRSGIWILITLATSTFQVPKSKVSGVRSLPSRSSMEIRTYEISSLLLPFCKILQFPSVSLSYQISADGRGFLVARLPSNIAELPAELLQPKTRDLNQISISFTTRPKPAYSRQGLAGCSLCASGAQLGSGKWSFFVTDTHCIIIYISSSGT